MYIYISYALSSNLLILRMNKKFLFLEMDNLLNKVLSISLSIKYLGFETFSFMYGIAQSVKWVKEYWINYIFQEMGKVLSISSIGHFCRLGFT